MFYFAYIDGNNVVTGVYAMPSDLSGVAGYILITEEQYNDPTLVGKVYDPETNTFNDPIIWVCKTSDVQYKDTNMSLEAKLDDIDEAIANAGSGSPVDAYTKTESDSRYATAEHTHTGFANEAHTHTAGEVIGVVTTINGTAPDENGNVNVSVSGGGMTAGEILDSVKTVDGANSGLDADMLDGMEASDFATADHTHTGYATIEDVEGKAEADHTHTGYAEVEHIHSDYATTDHTHTEYATTSDLSGKADTDHTHDDYITASTYANGMNGKADTNHSHNGYASSSHTHTPSSIGAAASNHTHSGYASSDHTHSQYSQSGHSHSTNGSCEFTGNIRTRDIVPDANDTRNIGGYSNRYKFIYSVNQLQVSSDERAKKDIVGLPIDELCDFVKSLRVVEYKYNDDESDKARIGLIAQEVITANPEIASYFVREEENGMLGLSVADLVFPLVATVQELAKEIEELKNSN